MPLSALPKDTTIEFAGLFSKQSLFYAERQAGKLWIPFFKVFWYDSTRGMNPRSVDCGADAPTTTPSRRYKINWYYTIFLFFCDENICEVWDDDDICLSLTKMATSFKISVPLSHVLYMAAHNTNARRKLLFKEKHHSDLDVSIRMLTHGITGAFL